MVPGAHQIPYADCYRCPLGLAVPELRHRLRRGRAQAGQDRVGGRGRRRDRRADAGHGRQRRSRPRSSCRRCASIADELDALLIADEMITGLGRTGTCWGVDHTGVRPDIVTIGKAFGGGFPLSGLLTTDEIARGASRGATRRARRRATAATRSPRRRARPRCASSTRRSLVENARAVGEVMLRELEALRRSLPVRRLRRRARAVPAHRAGQGQEDEGAAAAPGDRADLRRVRAARPADDGLRGRASASSRALTIDEATAKNGARDPARGLRPRRARAALDGSERSAGAAPLPAAREIAATSWRSGSAAATCPSPRARRARWARSRSTCWSARSGSVAVAAAAVVVTAGRHLGLGRRRAPPRHQGSADRLHRRGRGRASSPGSPRRRPGPALVVGGRAVPDLRSVQALAGAPRRAAAAAARASCSTTSSPASGARPCSSPRAPSAGCSRSRLNFAAWTGRCRIIR